MRVFASLLIAIAGCFAPAVREGVPCGEGGACPTSLRCDPGSQTCVREPGAGADAQVIAIDAPPDALVCPPGQVIENGACAPVCRSVLIYDDCTGPADADCASIPEPLFADDAATTLGLDVKYGGVANQPAFRTLAAAGGYDVMIIEVSLSNLDAETADSVAAWVTGGGRAIVSFWDLDNATTGATLRTALDVTTPASISTPHDVHPDPAAPVNLFTLLEPVPTPLVFTELMVDDGDELALAGGGFLAARQGAPDGAGAIAVTRQDRVITLGFLPVGLVFEGPRDADNDGKPDVEELYTNLLGYLCGY